MPEPIVIIGAGPAGLGAGLALGDQALLIERAANLGGLCQTVHLDGAVFDFGGHSFHTPHDYLRQLVFQALPMYEQQRQASCFVGGDWIPYPFQKHFQKLRNDNIRDECQRGLPATPSTTAHRNFGEQLEHQFGTGIVRHFLRPYNEKLWGPNLEHMASDWCAERVAAPVGVEQKFARSNGRRGPLQDDTMVAYPARGGFAEIFRALARRLPNIHFGHSIVQIDPRKRELRTTQRETIRWRHLISTLPLPQLLALLPDVPSSLADAARSLQAVPLALVFVVVNHPVDTPIQRVYCPGAEIPAHKIVINHNSSPYLRSLSHHGILAEVANPAPRSDRELTQQVTSGLEVLGLIRSANEILRTHVLHLPAAYPIPTLDRAAIVRELQAWLADRHIETVGRFGQWAYINSDEALHRGLCLGGKLALVAGNNADLSHLPQHLVIPPEAS